MAHTGQLALPERGLECSSPVRPEVASFGSTAASGLADLLAEVPDELFALPPEPQRVGLDAALLRALRSRG